MYATETATETRPGSWCQFCKAKLVCPSLNSLWGAAATCDPKQAILLDELALGMNLKLAKGVRQYLKALEDEVDRRLNAGLKVPGTKLVRKKANRVWKPQAEAYIIAFAGDAAMTRPELKSPAEIEKLPGAKLVVNKWAFTPDTGLTVALEDDPRVAVTVPTLEESFGAAVAQLDEG
jgi:hypothetical protein